MIYVALGFLIIVHLCVMTLGTYLWSRRLHANGVPVYLVACFASMPLVSDGLFLAGRWKHAVLVRVAWLVIVNTLGRPKGPPRKRKPAPKAEEPEEVALLPRVLRPSPV